MTKSIKNNVTLSASQVLTQGVSFDQSATRADTRCQQFFNTHATTLFNAGYTVELLTANPKDLDGKELELITIFRLAILKGYYTATQVKDYLDKRENNRKEKDMTKTAWANYQKVNSTFSKYVKRVRDRVIKAYENNGLYEKPETDGNNKTDLLRLQGMLTRAQELLTKEKIDGSIDSKVRAEGNKLLQVAFDTTVKH